MKAISNRIKRLEGCFKPRGDPPRFVIQFISPDGKVASTLVLGGPQHLGEDGVATPVRKATVTA